MYHRLLHQEAGINRLRTLQATCVVSTLGQRVTGLQPNRNGEVAAAIRTYILACASASLSHDAQSEAQDDWCQLRCHPELCGIATSTV